MSHFSIWTGSGNCRLNIYSVREMVLVRGLPVKLNGHTWWWSLSRIKNINYTFVLVQSHLGLRSNLLFFLFNETYLLIY